MSSLDSFLTRPRPIWRRLAAPFFASFCTLLVAQTPVPVGSGSYASFPSPAEDSPGHDVSGTLTQTLYIAPSVANLPVPTNNWWTDLIISRYSGDLWARPLTVSANATGIKISYPTTWNSSGTAFELGTPLEVSGTVVPTADPSDILMADFEGGGYPAGWTRTGTAFGPTPANGTLSGQSTVSGYYGTGLANSFNGGDAATGTLTSPTFTVDRTYISFLVGGGNLPGQAEVRLVVGGNTVLSATGVNSEQLRWVTWNVSAYSGRSAQIQIVDNATGGWGHILADQIFRTNSAADPAVRYNPVFSPDSANALRWGDWNVAFRMKQTSGPSLDVSLARGVPYVWLETNNLQPQLKTGTTATFFKADGTALVFPATIDRFAVVIDGKTFGVHAPAGTTFTRSGDSVYSTLGANYLVISALPNIGLLNQFHIYAFAVPRNSQLSWSYSPTAGKVTTTWSLDTVALQGTNLSTIQGWLPHHYRGTTHNLAFQSGITYATPRGRLQTVIGRNGWQIDYPFEGIAPQLPVPKTLGKANDYNPAILKKYLSDYAGETSYGSDTYWGGKSLTQYASYMTMAKQAGQTAEYEALKNTLRVALTDWFTYTPGENGYYFAQYPRWKALIGFHDSYGSYQFTDNHFHYGYYTLSAGLLAFEDPAFATGYGPMSRLVAKQYANWDRTDQNFPFLRTFDVWGGHSYAGGFSSPGGNNQESSSEAMQSWAGIFMLGAALNDTPMRDAGAMGYAIERAAVREYWLDVNKDILPAAYGHSSTGILFDSGQAYATYFSGDPAWMYGIQWLPTATHLSYLGWDRAFSKSLMADMIDDRPVTLLGGVAGGNRYSLWVARQNWYGIAGQPLNRDGALNGIKDAITNAYLHNPAYVGARNTANPLYNNASGNLYFNVNANGTLEFPATYWTPATFPAALVPPNASAANPAEDPATWNLWQYLGVNYTPDAGRMLDLYYYNVRGYSATETRHAADVYSRMGDGLGNVVLGFAAQYDPDFYADIHAALWARDDAVVKSKSMAGVVYYHAYSTRGLGVPDPSRHTSVPTSQVYRNPTTGTYSYIVYNPTTSQQTVTAYNATGGIVGTFPVPAGTLVNHGLDQQLATLAITASNSARTIQTGQTVQFTVTGYDQYRATYPLGATTWTVSGGGTINAAGLFTATTNADPVTVTAASGGKSQTYSFRVGPAPFLNNIAITPAFARLAASGAATFGATGLDQYGDAYALGTVTWTTTAPGATVSATGVFTGGTIGTGYVTAKAGSLSGTAVVSVQAAQTNIAQGKTATASSSVGINTPAAAVDGNATTRWESTLGLDNQWLLVDLGARYDLTRVFINWEPAYASTYQIQTGDSASGPWTTLSNVTKTTAANDDIAVSGGGRFLRINCLTRATAYGFSIFEVQAYGWLRGDAITPTTVRANPAGATLSTGSTIAYQAYAFNAAAQGGPVNATWTAGGGGTINSAGVYTATTAGGPYTITGAVGSVTGSTTVTVVSGSTPPVTNLVNVAIGKPTTASSAETPELGASAATDGNLGTRWSSNATDNQYLDVDLGTLTNIQRVDLKWEAAYGRNYRIQVRNTTSGPWTTVVTRTNSTGGNESHTVNVTARYVRMQGDARGTAWGYSLWEFEIYAPAPANSNLALNKPAFASSAENPDTTADKAVDGSTGTRWSSAATNNEWIYVDLGSARTVSSVTLVWEAAYASSYVIESTNNTAGTWTQLAAKTTGAGGTETLAVSGSYRYIRMRGITRATPYGYSLWEFEVR